MTTPLRADLERVLTSFFGDDASSAILRPFGSGLINSTYFVKSGDEEYILQRINTAIFKDSFAVMKNIQLVTEHIRAKGGETLDVVMTKDGGLLAEDPSGHFRMYKFVKDSRSFDVVTPELFSVAAEEFGKFQRYLSDFDASSISETIKDFHSTDKRLERFLKTVERDEFSRYASVKDLAEEIISLGEYAPLITSALAKGEIPTRVVHNDTKISNVLFSRDGRGLCVIDLDTVMPGSLLYDFGDAIRSGAAAEPEWSDAFEKVFLREDLYRSFAMGYIRGTGGSMTDRELSLLPLSAFVLTYELAIRFLDDYLDGDRYFAPKDKELNRIRAKNQLILAKDILSKLPRLSKITESCADMA